MTAPPYEVVVLAGGTSRRFGSDKIALLLDRVLAGVPQGVPLVCVGPARPTPDRPGVRWVREEPPGSGPLAAVAAALTGAGEPAPPVVVLLGGDMPSVGVAVPALVAALLSRDDAPEVDVVLLTDGDGRPQLLASAWRRAALAAAVAGLGDPAGVPLRRLLEQVDGSAVATVADRWGAAHDVDAPADLLPPGQPATGRPLPPRGSGP